MIPRSEFYTALSIVLAATSAPHGKETPIDGCAVPGLSDMILFDFWPDKTLRIVGTNGRRMAVVVLKVPVDAPSHGKFIMSVDKASEALLTFCPSPSDGLPGIPERTVTIGFFGVEQMMLSCSGGVDAMMVDAVKRIYPEYNILLQGGHEATKDAVYDAHTLAWVLEQVGEIAEDGVAVHIRLHGPTTFRPQITPGKYRCLSSVMLALKPFYAY